MQESLPPLIYVFTVHLLEIGPAIWRRIDVPERYSFWDLHVAIQDAMGWLDDHLHEYRLNDVQLAAIAIAEPDLAYPRCVDRKQMTGWLRNHYPFRSEKFDPAAVEFTDPAERFQMLWQ